MGKKAAKKKRERNVTIRLATSPDLLTNRVDSALARHDIEGACKLLSQARQMRKGLSDELNAGDRDLCARAYAAQAYARWEKPTQAIDSLDRAIELVPTRAEFHRLRGNSLRRLGRTKPAVIELADARRLAPGDQRIGLELLLTRLANGDRGADLADEASTLNGPAADSARALVAAFRGDLPSAVKAVSASQDPVGKLMHAVFLLAQGQAASAIPLLEKVVVLDGLPGAVKANALLYLGIAHVQRRELALAADALEKAQAFGAPEEQVQAFLGWVCQQHAIDAVMVGDLLGAARWFGRLEKMGGPGALTARNNSAQALMLAGQAAAKDGDYEAAVAAWSPALAIRPRDAALRQNQAIALERAGRTDEAVIHWKELVRQIPREAGKSAKKDERQRLGGQASADEAEMAKHIRALAHQHLADLYLEQDEVDLAVEQLERALQVLPSDVEIRRSLAITLLDEGRIARAIPHLERVVAASQASADDHVELGLAHLVTGDEKAGIEHLEKALALQPEHPLARLGLGKALVQRAIKSPRASDALAEVERALELLPAAAAFLGLMARGAIQLIQGDRRAADKSFKAAIKAAPNKPATRVKVGEAYWAARETKAAVAMWKQAMKEAREIPCTYANLVEAWAKAGDGPRCEKCLAASLNHNPDEALEAIERLSRSRELQPFLREVLHHVAAFTGDPIERVYLVQGLIYAGDMPGARVLLRSVTSQAVEEDDEEVLRIVTALDLKYKYNLLSHSTAEMVQAWIDANPGKLL